MRRTPSCVLSTSANRPSLTLLRRVACGSLQLTVDELACKWQSDDPLLRCVLAASNLRHAEALPQAEHVLSNIAQVFEAFYAMVAREACDFGRGKTNGPQQQLDHT